MDNLSATEAGVALTAIGGFIAAVAAVWINLRKQKRLEEDEDQKQKVHGYEVALANNEKMLAHKDKIIDRLAAEIDGHQEARAKCREEKAVLAQENKWLREELERVKGKP